MVATKHMTADDLAALSPDGGGFELILGEIVEVTGVGGRHGIISMRFSARVTVFVYEHLIGEVFSSDTRFVLARNPDVVVAPDFAFVRTDRLPPEADQIGYMPIPPDFAVEVVSTHDTRREVARKMAHYLAAGVPMTVVVEQATRTVSVHRPGMGPERFEEAETFDGGDVLPGFRMAVADLFR